MVMKYILLLQKKYLNNLIFIYVNNFYILTFFIFLHFSYVEVNFHFKTLRWSQFSLRDRTLKLILTPIASTVNRAF